MMLLILSLIGCGLEYGFEVGKDLEEVNNIYLEPDVVTDEYEVAINNKVDILLIIDNSCSMGDSQDTLGDNFPAVIRSIQTEYYDWDYHIGIITTDTNNIYKRGKLVDLDDNGLLWADNSTSNAPELFGDATRLGMLGSPREAGLESVWLSMEDSAAIIHNNGFYREDASLNMLIVTDESDNSHFCSNEVDIYGLPESCDASQFLGWLGYRRPDSSFSVLNEGNLNDYTSVAYATDGFHGLINNDWNALIPILTEQFTISSSDSYYLSSVPDVDTLSVTVNDTIEYGMNDCGDYCFEYRRQRNLIILSQTGYHLQDGDLVTITYDTLESSQ